MKFRCWKGSSRKEWEQISHACWGLGQLGRRLGFCLGVRRWLWEGRVAHRLAQLLGVCYALSSGAEPQQHQFLGCNTSRASRSCPEQLGPPGCLRESTPTQAGRLGQGPCGSEPREQPPPAWEVHQHIWAPGGEERERPGAGGQESALRSASAEPAREGAGPDQASSPCSPWAPSQATAEQVRLSTGMLTRSQGAQGFPAVTQAAA